MEFPDLGDHCSNPICNKLDFLPVKCDACSKIFCSDHMRYDDHHCPDAGVQDVQVPVCPLCNQPVPSPRGQEPDIAVGAHIDRDCQSDPAKDRRKVYRNRCTMKRCRKREAVPFECDTCHRNFCITHRHATDHDCPALRIPSGLNPAVRPVRTSCPMNGGGYEALQGHLGEDEALARALALSMVGDIPPQTSASNSRSNSGSNPANPNANCKLS